jgi:hypothetical protein
LIRLEKLDIETDDAKIKKLPMHHIYDKGKLHTFIGYTILDYMT